MLVTWAEGVVESYNIEQPITAGSLITQITDQQTLVGTRVLRLSVFQPDAPGFGTPPAGGFRSPKQKSILPFAEAAQAYLRLVDRSNRSVLENLPLLKIMNQWSSEAIMYTNLHEIDWQNSTIVFGVAPATPDAVVLITVGYDRNANGLWYVHPDDRKDGVTAIDRKGLPSNKR